jgi:hypothetical protein
MTDPPSNIIPIGKYKGRTVEEILLEDPSYLEWLGAQDWFRTKHLNVYQVIINRGGVPQDTPEHNALQVKFLDDDFCLRFLAHVDPKYLDKALTALRSAHQHGKKLIDHALTCERKSLHEANARVARAEAELLRMSPQKAKDRKWWVNDPAKDRDLHIARIDYLFDFEKEFAVPIKQLATSIGRKFEEGGVDVILSLRAKSAQHDVEPEVPADLKLRWSAYDDRGSYFGGWKDLSCPLGSYEIELKPTVGDDYPAVLRQMKANGSTVLLLRDYVGTGATREQFIATFATAGKRVVFLHDVEGDR